jgi:hypothetical protein
MVLRLAEQFLIHAEAKVQEGDIPAASLDLNVIRNRAGLPNYTGQSDQPSMLAAIGHERQVELFTEWGDRWFNLIRTGRIDSVMSVVAPQKNTMWSSHDQSLYPLPATELLNDPNLHQNQGY